MELSDLSDLSDLSSQQSDVWQETIGTARGCGVGSVNTTGIEELSDQWSRILRMKFQVEGNIQSLFSHYFSHIQSYSAPDAKQFFIILNVLACFGHKRTETPVSGSCFRPRRGREVQNARRPAVIDFSRVARSAHDFDPQNCS